MLHLYKPPATVYRRNHVLFDDWCLHTGNTVLGQLISFTILHFNCTLILDFHDADPTSACVAHERVTPLCFDIMFLQHGCCLTSHTYTELQTSDACVHKVESKSNIILILNKYYIF